MHASLRSTIKRLLVVILFFIPQSPHIETKSQSFIFKKYDRQSNNWIYYKTDLYNPSYIEKINITLCSDDKQAEPLWAPNGIRYGCETVYKQPLLLYDLHNNAIDHVTALLEQGNPKDPIFWQIGGWSPDSQYISIANTGTRDKPYHDFSIMKYDGTHLHQIYKNAHAMFHFGEWSPNGNYLALQVTPYGGSKSFFLIFDTMGTVIARYDLSKFINTPTIMAEQMKWSPDSKKIVFYTFSLGNIFSELYVLDLMSGKVINIISDEDVCIMSLFDWSPDSKKILFDAIKCKDGGWGKYYPRVAYSINANGLELKPLLENGLGSLHWTKDGKSIIVDGYLGDDLYLMDINGNNKQKLLVMDDNIYFVSWITS